MCKCPSSLHNFFHHAILKCQIYQKKILHFLSLVQFWFWLMYWSVGTSNHYIYCASESLRHDGNSSFKFLHPIWNFVKTRLLKLQKDEWKVHVGLFWNFSHSLFVSWVNLHTFKHDTGVIIWCCSNYSWEKFNFFHWQSSVFGDTTGEIIRIFF